MRIASIRSSGFLALLLFLLALSGRTLRAQVVIRESVEISNPGSSSKTLATNDTLTVTADGILDGDGLTKLQEYQGIEVGSTRYRLDCNRKEIFLDISEAAAVGGDVQTAVEWAAQELGSELDIETFYSESISGIDIDGNTTRFPGTNRLKWRGPNAKRAPLKGYVRVSAPLYRDPTPLGNPTAEIADALVADYDTYYYSGAPIRNDRTCGVKGNIGRRSCQPEQSMEGAELGNTDYSWHPDLSFSTVKLFRGTIANLYDVAVNRIMEAVDNHTFRYATAVTRRHFVARPDRGTVYFRAHFGNADVDHIGGKSEANPFDLLSDPVRGYPSKVEQNDDSTPGEITGLTQLDLLKRVALHEMAHSVGIWTNEPYKSGSICSAWRGSNAAFIDYDATEQYDCHHLFEESVMRSGFGPARTTSFTNLDKSLMLLKRPN